jgi:class 3 adenylate cyclase
MPSAETVNAKYVFLDVVGYSRGRTIEAQSHIIEVLNGVIRDAVTTTGIPKDHVLLLPTGDGVGIVCVDVPRPYDVDVRLALDILARIEAQNAAQTDSQRRFQVRIGVNENIDNLVVDVNGNRNVTGLGINQAQRIMSVAEGGNILLGQVVAERLQQRDTYQGKLRSLKIQVKHGFELRVCQLVDASIPHLNSREPTPLGEVETELLPKFLAVYMGLLIKHNVFVRSHLAPRQAVAMVAMFAMLADDVVDPLSKPGKGPISRVPAGKKDDLPALLEYYQETDVWVLEALTRHFVASQVEPNHRGYFEGKEKCLLVSDEGRRVLLRDWPQVARAMGLT